MKEKRDCTRVWYVPDSIEEILNVAQTIECLVIKSYFSSVKEKRQIDAGVERLREGLWGINVNSHINREIRIPVDGNLKRLTMAVRVTLVDHKLFLTSSVN